MAQCTVIWNYRTLFGVETPTFDKVHSILADHSFNLDVNALVGKVHTISAKRKTISAESIQFRKCLIGFCKRFPSSRLPSLGRLLSRLPCDSTWVFPDRPNFHVKKNMWPRKQSANPRSAIFRIRAVNYRSGSVQGSDACVALDW